uniref:Uncharacterized protein n=1 Tax=Arundo donax TaxID=35708 RepID=A0A0A8YWY6_ARUDO
MASSSPTAQGPLDSTALSSSLVPGGKNLLPPSSNHASGTGSAAGSASSKRSMRAKSKTCQSRRREAPGRGASRG